MSKFSIKQKVAIDYTSEFSLNTIKLAQSGEKNFAQTAKGLGIPVFTFFPWIAKSNKWEWPIPDENITLIKIKRKVNNRKSSGLSRKWHEQLNAEQKKRQILKDRYDA